MNRDNFLFKGRNYTVAWDNAQARGNYVAVISLHVIDNLTELVPKDLRLSCDYKGLDALVLPSGIVGLAGDYRNLFPHLAAGNDYRIDFRLSAPRYQPRDESITVSINEHPNYPDRFVTYRRAFRLRPLPSMLEGRVVRRINSELIPVNNASLRIAEVPALRANTDRQGYYRFDAIEGHPSITVTVSEGADTTVSTVDFDYGKAIHTVNFFL